MKKKFLILLIITIVAAGLFAQEPEQEADPIHTLTVDLGPTLVGIYFRNTGAILEGSGVDVFGFGIGLQYEQMVNDVASAALRFTYLGFGYGFSDSFYDASMDAGARLSCYSLEGHGRVYRGTFFVDGMAGLSYLLFNMSGSYSYYDDEEDRMIEDAISIVPSRLYLKLGVKIGWKFRFNGTGLVFEPSFGYYHGRGLGESLGMQLVRAFDESPGYASSYDAIFHVLERVVFVGGPRVSFGFGYTF